MSAVLRIWDKDYNLLYTGPADEPLYITKDRAGYPRWSGVLEEEPVVRPT